jgi:hypothetical protein
MLDNVNDVAAYFGGTYAEALAGTKAGMTTIYHNGKLKAKNAEITGTVNATDGEFNGKVSLANGKILLNKDGSGKLANGNVTWDASGNVTVRGKFESKMSGKRVVIDPSSNEQLVLYDSKNNEAASLEFYDDSESYTDSSISYGQIVLNRHDNGIEGGRITINPGRIEIFSTELNRALLSIDAKTSPVNIRILGLPTSSNGLPVGQLYRDDHSVCIV